MPDCALLFVYGTLRSRFENEYARFLAERADVVGPARILGRLYRIRHYAGATLSRDPDERVVGELYRLREPAATWPVLDGYEGCGAQDTPPYEFIRVEVEALTDAGGKVQACCYLYNRPVDEAWRIASGDFLEGRDVDLKAAR